MLVCFLNRGRNGYLFWKLKGFNYWKNSKVIYVGKKEREIRRMEWILEGIDKFVNECKFVRLCGE